MPSGQLREHIAHQIRPCFRLLQQILLANSDDARSVPAETTEAATRTSTHPDSNCGAGTSAPQSHPCAHLEELFHEEKREI